jgi:crotonobetainyl-CoA:carnitine CoA-transferase CaiB-like acyl-CoA transferase
MLDAVLAFVWPEGMAYHTFIREDLPKPKPVARRDLVYDTQDGYVVVSTVSHREWEGFCRAADRPQWLEDPRFKDTAGLVKNAKERLEMMAEVIAGQTTEYWLEALDREDVPCAPVLSRDEVHLDPQVIANGIIVEDDHPVAGRIRQTRPAERMDGTPSEITRPAPTLGQHTDEVLAELGLGSDEIEKLRATGALGAAA